MGLRNFSPKAALKAAVKSVLTSLYLCLCVHKGLMQSCNQMHASYLFQQDKHYDLSYDTGDKALQCGRHVDVFKLWLMWRAKVGLPATHLFVLK